MSRNQTPPMLHLRGLLKDLGGGLTVRRLLPSLQLRAVGPFVFFDHFGPVTVTPDSRIDVRPHPHIGLATVTYLLEGAMQHRDSLGNDQRIEPGAINWMSAGRGIVHSERRPDAWAEKTYVNHGLQLWAALPLANEQDEPHFSHTPAKDIPVLQIDTAQVRVLLGQGWGHESPVVTSIDAVLWDIELKAGKSLELPPSEHELALYTVNAQVNLDRELVQAQTLVPLSPRTTPHFVQATDAPARCIVLGGAPLDAPRHLWWNFVASDKAMIEQAAQRWEDNGFGRVAGDDERIPLPGRYLRR